MQYQVRSTGKAEYLFFEEEAIKHIRPAGGGVELRLEYNRDYVSNPSYRWDGLRSQHILSLTRGQALEVVRLDREKQTDFCQNCYDHGKSDKPDGCVRCEIIKALRAGGYDAQPSAAHRSRQSLRGAMGWHWR